MTIMSGVVHVPGSRVRPAGLDLPRAGDSLPPDAFASVRAHMLLNACKWDPQVGDIATLATFPLLISERLERFLFASSEALAAEALEAERVALEHPECLRSLGMPGAARRVLSETDARHEPPVRVVRFDFHPTSEGWRISEANADVPGGYSESSTFPELMAEHFPKTRTAGNPCDRLTEAIARVLPDNGAVALVSAPGYMEDHQVVAYLAGQLRELGVSTAEAAPAQIEWDHDQPSVRDASGRRRKIDAIVRFYQGEWLGGSRTGAGSVGLLRSGPTAIVNPGSSLIVESKRFPLIWDRLGLAMPAWRAFLPETTEVGLSRAHSGRDWVLKAAYANNGDEVLLPDLCHRSRRRNARIAALLRPNAWCWQRRFHPIAIPTPLGRMDCCLGIYTINGRASGIYGRISSLPLIDHAAIDVAVLVEAD